MKIVCEQRSDEGIRMFKNDNVGTIRTIDTGGDKRVIENDKNTCCRIRKLTPLESWRLMGFSDEDFISAKTGSRETAKQLIEKYEPNNHLEMMNEVDNISKASNTQLYKQAGNSIVTNVLFYIYQELYKVMPYLFDDLKVGSFFSGIGAFEIALNRLFKNINNQAIATSEPSGGERSNCI